MVIDTDTSTLCVSPHEIVTKDEIYALALLVQDDMEILVDTPEDGSAKVATPEVNTSNAWRPSVAEVGSFTTPGVSYYVFNPAPGVAVCTCPDYRYHKMYDNGACKHIIFNALTTA